MHQLLGNQIVVNIDDLKYTPRGAALPSHTQYIPRKMSRAMRALRTARLTSATSEKLRSEWMLETISQSNASLVFVHFVDFALQFNDVWHQLGIPVVVHCHGVDITWDTIDHVKKKPVHPPEYEDRVRSFADNVWFIANSTYTAGQLRKLDINPKKIFLKRFGVTVADRPKSPTENESSQVLYLGRLVDFKGPLDTARAFSRIVSQHRDTSLEVAGGGELATELDQLIRELNISSRVNCHGPVDQVRGEELRRRACIFTAHNQTGVITRREEAFGVSLLEAMGEGIPVVTGRSGGIPDFIRHEENGLLFEPGDIDAHAGMLDDLLSSKRRRESLGIAAWETVRENYQPCHELADMNRIFEQVSKLVACPTLDQPVMRPAA